MTIHPPIIAARRIELEQRIEELIEMLDLLDGDADLEPYLADTYPATEDREEENEHAGDIQDEPHDHDDDLEHSLGWSNPMGLRAHIPEEARQLMGGFDGEDRGSLIFDGDGHHGARKLLREHIKDRRKLAHALDVTRVSPGYGRYV